MTTSSGDEHPLLLTTERILSMYAQMTDSEKIELSAWEHANVTGDGAFATSGWPGWKVIFNRLSH